MKQKVKKQIIGISEIAQLILFKLDDELFSFRITNINEIQEMINIVRVPNADSFIEGIINLRGEVITIINLKKKLGLANTDILPNSMIMVARTETQKIGLLVDSVKEVKNISEDDVEPAPKLVAGISTDYLEGIGKVDDEPVIILDFNKIIAV
ncbi:chemotaxis protein CheW [Candidatus Dependentiae bacterium]|nr:chemotaxis protein CheW [Candidatus Dependentiae bacterium]